MSHKEQAMEFLRRVLPEEGFICFSHHSGGYWKDYPYNNIGELLGRTWAETENCNCYFGTSTYARPSFVGSNGKSHFRCAQNALWQKALWLDIDCKNPDEYGSWEEATKAVSTFCDEAGLHMPLMVCSGRGLHCYWPFDNPLPPNKWQPLAETFKDACIRAGLKADHHRTCDQASVMRIPGTINHGKDGVKRQVQVFHWNDETYKPE